MPDLTRRIEAPSGRQCGAGGSKLRVRRNVGTVGPRVEHGRGVVRRDAPPELLVHGDVGLGIDFPEAQIGLDHVAVDRQATGEEVRIEGAIAARGGAEARPARIPIIPATEVELDWTEGRADAGIAVDLRGRAVRERDALGRDAGVELEVLGGVEARLEIGRDRRLVVRLRDAAEDVIRRDAAAEGDVPRAHRRRRRRCLGDHLQISSERGRRQRSRSDDRQDQLLHFRAPKIHANPRRSAPDRLTAAPVDRRPPSPKR